MKKDQLNSKMKKAAAAVTLAAMLATGGAHLDKAEASVAHSQVEFVTEDPAEELARTQADWKKLLKEYRNIDCNFDVESVTSMLEIEEFIETTYSAYFDDELSDAFIVDDVIAYRHASVDEIGFARIIADWKALDRNNEAAVREFLGNYGKYLSDIHAHNYFILINLISGIRNDVAWYVKQDVENSDFIREEYAFDQKEFQGGELSDDLSAVGLNYTDGSANYHVNVDITAPNDGNEAIGDGFVDIQSVYGRILTEVNGLGTLMNTGVYNDNFYGMYSFATFYDHGTLNGQQVYQIAHNDNINELIREGLRVIATFNPAVTYENMLNGENPTPYGYGHWFIPNPSGNMIDSSYDANSNTYNVGLTETIECPTKTLDATFTLR